LPTLLLHSPIVQQKLCWRKWSNPSRAFLWRIRLCNRMPRRNASRSRTKSSLLQGNQLSVWWSRCMQSIITDGTFSIVPSSACILCMLHCKIMSKNLNYKFRSVVCMKYEHVVQWLHHKCTQSIIFLLFILLSMNNIQNTYTIQRI